MKPLVLVEKTRFGKFFDEPKLETETHPIRNQTGLHQRRHSVDSGDDKFLEIKKSQLLTFRKIDIFRREIHAKYDPKHRKARFLGPK